ncbi:peptide ABC transporter permease (plasmid) [Halostagnicola larsenii XH-48]|uniref:Peptide ABC transporter permease n=1 Tax=Halostagnicola larsenii XH-48 TaxID=797299 RepID=W0JX74_9EURY|nr:ABC transporter permease [Halostagnicola larsenii]AHG01805.1 peptide ABC transporter permease [Halostagnicola larsenii XH-48]
MVSKRIILKRLLLLVPVLLGVATFVFAILHLSPGNPARTIAGERASEEFVRQIESDLGLNDPIYVQYGRFLLDAAQLDFGNSYVLRQDTAVIEVLRHRFPVTLELAIYGQIVGILFGIPLGILSAVKQDSLTDHITRIGALTGISVPIFWSGPLLIMIFAQGLGILPTSGRIASIYSIPHFTGLITVDAALTGHPGAFLSAVKHMFLPTLVLGIYSMALISRMMRSSMLEVTRQDYMRTARAKGQGMNITIMKHGFRNALVPVVTIIGLQFGSLLGGAVLTETVFSISGIGNLLVEAISVGDYPVVQGTVLLFAFLYTLVNLGVDLTYSILDPRIDQ